MRRLFQLLLTHTSTRQTHSERQRIEHEFTTSCFSSSAILPRAINRVSQFVVAKPCEDLTRASVDYWLVDRTLKTLRSHCPTQVYYPLFLFLMIGIRLENIRGTLVGSKGRSTAHSHATNERTESHGEGANQCDQIGTAD
jgi:hypothetical protein